MKQLILEYITLLSIKSKQITVVEIEISTCRYHEEKRLKDANDRLNKLNKEYAEIEAKIAELLEKV